MQTGTNLADPDRFKFDGTGYYVKSPAEMRAVAADAEWQAGCDQHLLIAERCEVGFAKQNLMPRFPIPDGETEEGWLRGGGLARHGPPLPRRLRRGAQEPRRVRDGRDHADGVLRLLPGGGRLHHLGQERPASGSAPAAARPPGRMVAYALGITDLDPVAHGLMFERFLNPERISMPDVDIDFDERRRGDVIRYVTEKYGDDRVAQIVTYGTIKAKAAVKDAARVLGYPYAIGDRITKALPAGGDGQGHPAGRHHRPDAPPLRRGRRDPRACTRPSRTSRRSSTPPGASRAWSGRWACTRPA